MTTRTQFTVNLVSSRTSQTYVMDVKSQSLETMRSSSRQKGRLTIIAVTCVHNVRLHSSKRGNRFQIYQYSLLVYVWRLLAKVNELFTRFKLSMEPSKVLYKNLMARTTTSGCV